MFSILEIPAGAAETTEPLGTKYKFWYRDPNHGRILFKEGRPGTGENWAECIACALAKLLKLPHAFYNFATYEGREGVISISLVDNGARLIHGNELLADIVTDYIQEGRYSNSNHTLRRVIAYLRASGNILGAPFGWPNTENIRTAVDFFIGYLMFDAWIGNQDRHDENWGILRMIDGSLYLSPSFDHGSSMARNEPDEKRLLRLNTKDMPRHISTFVSTARSGFFPTGNAAKPLPLYTLDAFTQAALHSPSAAEEWRDRLRAIDDEEIKKIIGHVPIGWMTQPARLFTIEFLRLNRQRILDAKYL